ncbi:hypothetical protein [Herbiconiux sp. VKM Ac-2851]|uniref:hypothetical protein n=1 Tax=Herbiconiux sp. VKM Ac-2851 TaxID=2739025 RepID=UPI001563FBB5|nr:hypothetical protein [Herbiconiux sp. VKM Ac-2851]NQX37170.1 hypothetical protein [Herbiconiux sp. VKM Ac-2851]
MTDTGGDFIDHEQTKPIQVTVDGDTYRVQSSQVAYDLEIIADPEDTVIGYIARLTTDAAGFVPADQANEVLPAGNSELEDGIRALLNR